MPKQNMPNGQPGATYVQNSPAYVMAARIKNEQGAERAGEYLAAMEPFLAPGERAHIAARLGVPMIVREPPRQAPQYQAPPQGTVRPQANGGMGEAMQMMQMLSMLGSMNGQKTAQGNGGSGFGGLGGMGGLGGDPMMLAQMLSGLMGKK